MMRLWMIGTLLFLSILMFVWLELGRAEVTVLSTTISGEDQATDHFCLAKMEAAMRNMEFFLLITLPHTYQVAMNQEMFDTRYPYAYHFTLPAEDVSLYRPEAVWSTWNAKAWTAIVSWESAKACWRQP